jgi:hypothetical protein
MTKSNAKNKVVKNESIHKDNKASNLQVVTNNKAFIEYAKLTIENDREVTKKLTFTTIASVVCLAVSFYKKSTSEVLNKDGGVNQNKLRSLILDSLFSIKEKKTLQSSNGRVIYNKIKAGLIVFNKDFSKLLKAWESYAKDENGESMRQFIDEVESIVESYKSLTKILDLTKKPKAKKEESTTESESETLTDEVAESESDSDEVAESTKSDYTRVNEALSLVIKLLDREEKRDSNFLNMVKNHLDRIVEGLQKNGYYTSQKLKEGIKKIA